ncbi:MAG: hypothetical protein R6X25_06720 [Candidatus Krumholzibacteriia bacterium]
MPIWRAALPSLVFVAGLMTAVAGLAVAPDGALAASTELRGYYAAEIAMEMTDRKWHFGPPGDNAMPSHYAELQFWAWPSDRYETFIKIRALSNRDDDRTPAVDFYTPPWLAAEGHLKLRGESWEGFIFSRESRFYINDEPLLGLINDGKLKNDDWGPKAQGVRLDTWDRNLLGIRNLGGTLIFSDNGGTFPFDGRDVANGEDSWILRLRHRAFGGRIESGFMFLRKDWTDTSREDFGSLLGLMYNNVYSLDVAFTPRDIFATGAQFGPVNLEQSRITSQVAFSERPYHETVFSEPRSHARALAVELREVHVEQVTLHAWHNDFGEDFRSYLSSRFDDERQYNKVQNHVEAIWLLPRKAVTTKLVYDSQRKRVADEPGGGRRPSEEWYGELYMEFVNGFKARFAHRQWHGFDESAEIFDFYTYPDWFAEISVENFLAKVRLQGRIRDAGTFRQVRALGFDMNVNLTDRVKGYFRAMNVDEHTEARHTIFAQLKYELGGGAELYFEYGDPGQSDNLVRTDWFVNEGNGDNLRDRLKLLVRAWF